MAPYLGLLGSIVGAASQASAARAQAQQQYQMAMYNAQQAENQRNYARQAAAAEAQRYSIQAQKEIGSMRAGYGASGVELEGSPLDVLQDSAELAKLDELNIIHRGEVQAVGYQNTANLDRFRAQSAISSGRSSASSALALGIFKGVTGFVGNGGFGLSRTG